jgi:hypothetical protein
VRVCSHRPGYRQPAGVGWRPGSCSGLHLSALGRAIIGDSGSRSVRLSMLSGSCCVILGSRSVRRTCNHRFAETDAGGWQAGKRGISGPSYDEVTGIFVRVNSLGAKLRSSDLALAQITAKWHNSLSTFEAFQQQHGQDPQGRLRRGDRHARQLPAPTAAPAHHAPRFLKIFGDGCGARCPASACLTHSGMPRPDYSDGHQPYPEHGRIPFPENGINRVIDAK